MKKLATILILALAEPSFADDDLWEAKGPHVRIKRNNQDKSTVEFRRMPDDRKLVKTTRDKEGNIQKTAVYIRNDRGFLTAGRIYDGAGTKLFRVRYGYDRETGLLIAEEMFDVRNPYMRFDEENVRREFPIRRIYYFYDAQGNQSKALSLSARRGKSAEEVFGKGQKPDYQEEEFNEKNSTRPDKNPFDQRRRTR